MVIQMIYMGKPGYLSIKGIKPDKDSQLTGEIDICTNSFAPARREKYIIENDLLMAESCIIPMDYIVSFLQSNDCVRTDENGEECVILKEVEFKMNDI